MSFSKLDKDKLIEISKKGGQGNRTPELAYVWDNADKIRKETLSVTALAKKYKISTRSMYRVINGK